MVGRVADADVSADRATIPHLDVGDRRATSARIGLATSTSDEAMSWVYVTIAPISSIPSEEKPIVRSSSRSARSTSTSGAAARAFMTLTIV